MSLSAAVDLRRQVNLIVSKLSDRDTLPRAAADLDSLARGLTRESFSTFIACLVDSEQAPARVRRQCVGVLRLVAHVHGESLLSHHVTKMLSAVVRCLRDSDSALRAACVHSVSSMASKITKAPFSLFLTPLADAVLHEQDQNSQTGSALCLAAAIEASPNPKPMQLQKLLPKFLNLVTRDCFKAKASLLSLIGTVACAGGTNPDLLSGLVSCLLRFLGSKEWAARKAAGEALARLAVAEREMLTEFRASVLATLENRRFDTVKIVRDIMNNTLKLWKEVPETVLPQSQCQSSSKDKGGVTCSPPHSRSSSSNKFETTQPKKNYLASRSPSSNNLFASTPPNKSPSMICGKKPNATSFGNTDDKDCEVVCADDLKNKAVGCKDIKTINERNSILKLETRRALFRKNIDEKFHKSGSRVVPLYDGEFCDPELVQYDDKRDVDVNQKEMEDLNVISKQLIQIENQQSNLLELLQRFMGSSQSGMNQLENRVNGLEKSLDEISQNLEGSKAGISNSESAENSCCRLPGADFLSPKFWKRAEGQYSYSSFSLPQRNQSLSVTRANSEMQKIDGPLQKNQVNMHWKLEQSSSENVAVNPDEEKLERFNTDGVHKIFFANRVASANGSHRSSTKDGS